MMYAKLIIRTGLELKEAYPLKGYQRYYEPRWIVNTIQSTRVPEKCPAEKRPATPPFAPEDVIRDGDDAWNPGSRTPNLLPLSSSTSQHWTMDHRLHGKSFLAKYNPPDGPGQDRVHATPDISSGRVKIWWGKQPEQGVPPEHIEDFKPRIKPETHEGGILAVRGIYTGMYMRRIHCKYDDDKHSEVPWITAMTFGNWGQKDEYIDKEWVLVDVMDCAPVEIKSKKAYEKLDLARTEARKHRHRKRRRKE
jgi:hypothetical protein